MQKKVLPNGLTELSAEAGGYLTQTAPNKKYVKEYCTKRILLANEPESDWRDATKAERDKWVASPPPIKPTRTALTPIYEAAGAVFNDATGFYELNGIMDIGEEEMALIYETANINGITIFSTDPFGELIRRTNIGKVMQIINIAWCRILPTFLYHYAAEGDSLEVYSFGVERIYPKTFDYSFYNLHNLREVRGIIDLTFCESFVCNFGIYSGCPNLVHLKVYGLKSNWNIQTLKSLSMECVRYIISNANPKYEITLTLFTPIYEACLTDAEVQKALESHPLLRLAGGRGYLPI